MQREQFNRRSFMVLASGALAWSDGVCAQEPRMPVIGFLNVGSADRFVQFVDAFRQGLSEGGYIEGRNIAIEYRWADGQPARLPELAADLVRRRVSLIAATGGSTTATAAKIATTVIPVVFIGGPDPVADGLVSSLNSPNGNLTGVAMRTSELSQKRLQLLLELIPGATKIGLLLNTNSVEADAAANDFEARTRALGRQPILLKINSESDLEPAFVSAVHQGVGGLLVGADPVFTNRRSQIVALAARHAMPAAYAWREFVEAGGLLSYGPSIAWGYRLIGQYASRILKGEKPRGLPVQTPTRFETVINRKVATALSLKIPRIMLAGADEIID